MSDDPMAYVRVLDVDTGHKRSVRRIELPHGNYRELDEPALDVAGEPLPPEFKSVEPTTGQKATTQKEKH